MMYLAHTDILFRSYHPKLCDMQLLRYDVSDKFDAIFTTLMSGAWYRLDERYLVPLINSESTVPDDVARASAGVWNSWKESDKLTES